MENMEQNIPKVLVLMATYNGERFLKEQLDSIIGQKGVDVTILVRDDGSTDNTRLILEEYASVYCNIIVRQESNVGCKRCFYKLAYYGMTEFPDYRYFAFSDQDDVWLENKLSSAINHLEPIENDIPGLCITSSQLVDGQLNPLPVKKYPFSYSLGESLLLQPAAGCSMLFNRELLNLFLLASPDDMFLHDEWIYKVCLACGGKVIKDGSKHLLYRQHGKNTIGGNQGFVKSWKRRFRMFSDRKCLRSTEADRLMSIYREFISEQSGRLISLLANYRKNSKVKWQLLASKEITTKRKSFNIAFKLAVLFNRF